MRKEFFGGFFKDWVGIEGWGVGFGFGFGFKGWRGIEGWVGVDNGTCCCFGAGVLSLPSFLISRYIPNAHNNAIVTITRGFI